MVSFTDDFNRADAGNLGANYNRLGGSNCHSIVSNQAKAVGTGINQDWYVTQTTTADGKAGATFRAFGSGVFSVIGRFDGTFTGTADSAVGAFYHFRYNGTTLQLARKAANSVTFTSIGSAYTVTLVAGDVIEIRCTGTAIEGYLNGVLRCSATDSTITTAKYWGFRTSGSTTNTVDDFYMADITAVVTITAPPASGNATFPVPLVSGPTTIAAPPAAANATFPAPTLGVSIVVTSPPAAANATFPVPTITGTFGTVVVAPPAGAGAEAIPPVLTALTTLTGPGASATATMPVPTLVAFTAGPPTTIVSPVLSATAAVMAPTVVLLGTVVRGSVSATLDPPAITAVLDPPALTAEWSRP